MASKFIGIRSLQEVPKSMRDGGSKFDLDIDTIRLNLKKYPGQAVELQADEKHCAGLLGMIKKRHPEWKGVIRNKTNLFVWEVAKP
jgi:hypothetical protein